MEAEKEKCDSSLDHDARMTEHSPTQKQTSGSSSPTLESMATPHESTVQDAPSTSENTGTNTEILEPDNSENVRPVIANTGDYAGFDPFVIRRELQRLGGMDLTLDLPALFMLYIMRGTNINKAMGTMSESGRAKVSVLVNKYKINGARGQNRRMSGVGITMSRIAASYPEPICKLIVQKPDIYSGPIKPSDYEYLYPAYMMLPLFATLIPKNSRVTKKLVDKHFEFMIDFDRVIHSMDGKLTPKEVIKHYQMANMNSPLYMDPDRMRILVTLGLCEFDQDSKDISFKGDYEHVGWSKKNRVEMVSESEPESPLDLLINKMRELRGQK